MAKLFYIFCIAVFTCVNIILLNFYLNFRHEANCNECFEKCMYNVNYIAKFKNFEDISKNISVVNYRNIDKITAKSYDKNNKTNFLNFSRQLSVKAQNECKPSWKRYETCLGHDSEVNLKYDHYLNYTLKRL